MQRKKKKYSFEINVSNHAKKNAPNRADNISIFQSCLLPKMRLSVVLEGRFTGYKPPLTLGIIENLVFWREKSYTAVHCGGNEQSWF